MKVVNLHPENDKKKNKAFKPTNTLMPQIMPFRFCIVGQSGSGKTVNLSSILEQDWVRWDTLTIYAKNPDQKVYNAILKKHDKLIEKNKCEPFVFLFDNIDNCVPIDMYDSEKHNVVVFDDFTGGNMSDSQLKVITDHCIRGRSKGISVIILAQGYHAIPKNSRLQASFLVIYKTTNKNDRKAVWEDHCSDMTYQEFSDVLDACTAKRHDFLCVDVLGDPLYKLRRNYDEIYVPHSLVEKEEN